MGQCGKYSIETNLLFLGQDGILTQEHKHLKSLEKKTTLFSPLFYDYQKIKFCCTDFQASESLGS